MERMLRLPSISGFLVIFALIFLMPRRCGSCYTCFTTPEDRADLCKFLTETPKLFVGLQQGYCHQFLQQRFQALNELEISYGQKRHISGLLRGVTQRIKNLKSDDFGMAMEKEIDSVIDSVKDIVARNPPKKCKAPCGFQKEARTFKCNTCVEEDCDLPVDCPLVDIKAKSGELAIINCKMPFTIPEDIVVVWKFAFKIRTRDISSFKDIHYGDDLYAAINPARVHHTGTYACVIKDDDDDIIGEGYYFLNVTKERYRSEKQMVDLFDLTVYSNMTREKVPKELETTGPKISRKVVITLSLGCGMMFLLVVLLLGLICHCCCCRPEKEESMV